MKVKSGDIYVHDGSVYLATSDKHIRFNEDTGKAAEAGANWSTQDPEGVSLVLPTQKLIALILENMK